MTTNEMSRAFDIAYNNINSQGAPGINNFEKSVIFTKAQDDLVRSIYSPFNLLRKPFEGSENRRTELKELIKAYSSTVPIINSNGLSTNSKFFEIPNDVYYIIQEEIETNSTACVDSPVMVIPMTHDEYNIQKKSPFRKPNNKKAWRMDISKLDENPVVEIIFDYNITKYKMRYIKKPKPIIFSNFETDPELIGMSLTVDGLNTITECELNSEYHNNILDRAVEIATLNYRENSLQTNVELNNRNV